MKGISEQVSYKSTYAFNDTSYPDQSSNLSQIGFEPAQAGFAPSSLDAVKVGIIDTGIAADPDLVVDGRSNYSNNNVSNGAASPLFAGDDQTKPNHFHGTFIAGIIGATQNNSAGVAGIAPNAHLYAYGIGSGLGLMTNIEIGNAIQGAVADGMEVINMSFGTSSGGGVDDPMVRDGIVDGYVKSVIFVAAAGNSSINLKNNGTVYPAQYAAVYDNVIAVAASDETGFRASFSNYGGPTNIMAPGSSVFSLNPANLGGGVIVSNGTSFAGPMVSAAVALAIGNLKHRGFPIDPKSIRNLVTVTGANQRVDLLNDTKNGAFLDLRLLATALAAVQNQTTLAASIARGTDALGNGTVQLTINWDSSQLTGIPANARLGVFDLSSGCTYSAPCLITSLSWPVSGATCVGTSCSLSVVLSRAQVIAMMPGKGDPTGSLPLSIAVYHPVPDPNTGKTKNTYGIDYSTIKDLRSLNNNTGQPVQGAIENIRMDMSYLYVQGWACRPVSEEAVSASVVSGGNALVTDYAYSYELMQPHSAVDGGDFADFGNNVVGSTFGQYPHQIPYQVTAISILQKRHSSFKASLEGNAQLIKPCQTLTAAHGFEFVIPLQQIRDANLAGAAFQVIVDGTTAVPDSTGASTFTIPEPPSIGTTPSLAIARSPASLQMKRNHLLGITVSRDGRNHVGDFRLCLCSDKQGPVRR